MFFDHYPYTNFHNVNLDWVLQAVKAWGQTVEANDRAFRDLKEANEDFKEYVRNYLQDLDITDEINTKLDNMLASGVLTPYFAPYVQGYVNSWLNSHVTPTSPALDNTLTLSGAAARADSTGHRLKDLAYIDALSTPEIIAALNRSQVLPGYRVQGIAYDYNGHYYVCGGSVDETGTGVIVKMTKPDFTDAEITEIPQLGHANDITYYDGYLYVCTVGGGEAPRWGIYKINVNDFTDKTLISNAPENTIGISYRQGDFWILAPYRIYRTTDFTSYEVVVANTNDLLTAYGIPTDGRISQTIFRAAGYLIGWVCSFVFEDRHYGALTFFNSAGEPIAFKMFPAYHTEIQGAVYADMSIYLVADGNMVNIFRMDPRHLSYVQLKAGDDLNSFTGRGTLYSTGSNVSAELLNSPSAGEGFTVQVDRLGVYNTIQTARTNSGRELYRIKSFNSDTWGEWIEPAAEVSQIKEELSEVESGYYSGLAKYASVIPNGTDLDTLTTAGNYKVTSASNAQTIINLPLTVAFALKVVQLSFDRRLMQVLLPQGVKMPVYRRYYDGSVWYPWELDAKVSQLIDLTNVILTADNYTTYFPNALFADAKPNTIYGIHDSSLFSDAPIGDAWIGTSDRTAGSLRGTLMTFSQANSHDKVQTGLTQIFVGYRDTNFSPTLSYRIAIVRNGVYTWSGWSKFEENGYLHASNMIVYGGSYDKTFSDLNDAPNNSIVQIDLNNDSSDAEHTLGNHPAPGVSCVMMTYAFSYTTNHGKVQTLFTLDGRMYWRYGYQQSPGDYRWKTWSLVNADIPKIPEVPNSDGTYMLICSVTNGEKTYSWQTV